MDYAVQNVVTWDVMLCTKNEAIFWSILNDTYFGTVAYNIYNRSSMQILSTSEIV